MSSTMEGHFLPSRAIQVPKYYSLPEYVLTTSNCVISYEKRYVWLNNRLGEKLVVDLSRCETY